VDPQTTESVTSKKGVKCRTVAVNFVNLQQKEIRPTGTQI